MSGSLSRLISRGPGSAATPGDPSDAFLDWVRQGGLDPYPEQLEALAALAERKHVVLATPTGSGKSLVALGLHFIARCEGARSFYTSPTKALANEKFFALCNDFGPDSVGMLTGDASVNHDAPIICCTAEVLSNMCLRDSLPTAVPYVVMDEFHYYGDAQRGSAWQVPLLSMPRTVFLMMSATIGDPAPIVMRLREDTGRPVVVVASGRRPVPLEYEYSDSPLHRSVRDLVSRGRAPIYVVSFSQRGAAEVAGSLTSTRMVRDDHRALLSDALAAEKFETPYGREVRRLLSHGIGLHHAGLLPRYRLLVERLSQQGLLRVVSGTDTLGVGVNVPIRTVLFNSLVKFDGERVGILSARAFHQIAGRAGRKGFDDLGTVVVQAPDHVIENKHRRSSKRRSGGRKGAPRRAKRKPARQRGRIQWSRQTFRRLIAAQPEALPSRFRVDHGMVLSVLQRDVPTGGPRGYQVLVDLVMRSHESRPRKLELLRDAASRFRSLHRAGLVRVHRSWGDLAPRVEVDDSLQDVFSLHESLSLYLVHAVLALDAGEPQFHMRVVSLVESILDDPVPILRRQERIARSELLTRLKSRGVPYEERSVLVSEVSYSKPEAAYIARTYPAFVARHPWLGATDVHPKSIARDMLERRMTFAQYVRAYGIQRSEGLLLRHLSRVYDTLVHTIPDNAKTDRLQECTDVLSGVIRDTDTSLIDAWERMRAVQDDPRQ